MDDFFSSASHRLRGPLNVIAGWVGVLRAGAATPAVLEQAATAIDRSCRAQVELVEGILQLWSLSEGAYTIERTPVELVPCLRAAVDETRALAEAKRIAVNARVDHDGLTVSGHRPSLERAMTLLLRHAIDRSPERAPVGVRLGAASGLARLEVTDLGPAVGAPDLPSLFDRYRAPEPGGAPHGHINLDLAIARRLAALHDGGLTARSGPDGGLTFVLSLPLLA